MKFYKFPYSVFVCKLINPIKRLTLFLGTLYGIHVNTSNFMCKFSKFAIFTIVNVAKKTTVHELSYFPV